MDNIMKYALVTGGSRGIGRAICLKLAEMGYHVLINYVSNHAEAEKTLGQIQQIGRTGELLRFDTGNHEEVQACLEEWARNHSSDEYIEVLVNNAGIRKDNILAFMEECEWREVIATSLDGFYNVTRPLITPMMTHRYGRIINMASVSGMKGMPGQTNYSAAKGGLIAATKALALEVARKNITVNAIAPGFIQTDMIEGLDEATLKKSIPANRLGTPEEVAGLVGFLASPQAGYITGNAIAISGGLYT